MFVVTRLDCSVASLLAGLENIVRYSQLSLNGHHCISIRGTTDFFPLGCSLRQPLAKKDS